MEYSIDHIQCAAHTYSRSTGVFSSNAENFSSLFRRILSMSVDDSLSTIIQTHLVTFLISAFQSLDSGLVRKECAPLVSISIWHHLADEQSRETKFEEHGQLRKAWRAASKRYDAGDDAVRARLQFDRSWLYSMTLKLVKYLYSPQGQKPCSWFFSYRNSLDYAANHSLLATFIYCERLLELLIDIEGQLPTRRYVNGLIQDLNLLSLIKLSPAFKHEDNGLLRDLFTLLRHFVNFSINDHTGSQYTRDEAFERHCSRLARLQRTSLKLLKPKLTILALSNYGAIEQRSELENHLNQLMESELVDLCKALGIRTSYPPSTDITVGKELVLEVLISSHERQKTFQEVVKDMSVLPIEVFHARSYGPKTKTNTSRLTCMIRRYYAMSFITVLGHWRSPS